MKALIKDVIKDTIPVIAGYLILGSCTWCWCSLCLCKKIDQILKEIKMGLAEVKKYFEDNGITNEIILLDKNTATVELAAAALGRQPGEIAKTLSFVLKDGSPILVVVMGTARIDNHKYKDRFGCKASMIPFDDVPELIGHAVGGVCPFGVKEGVQIFLDESLKQYETVFPAAGTDNSAVPFTIAELEAATKGTWVDVCK